MFKTSMKSSIVIALLLTSTAASAVVLPSSGTLRKFGASATNSDQLYLASDPRSNMTLLDSRSNDLIFLGDNIGSVLDEVWQDKTTGYLSFFTRIEMTEAGYEVNDIVRKGFAGFTTDVNWFKANGSSLATQGFRLKSTARTDSIGTATDVYNDNAVNLRSDISVEEGKPTSGWYVIKTNATFYSLYGSDTSSDYGFFLRSTGEDVGAPASAYFSSFAPSVMAVPEPSEYAMFLAGVGVLGVVARRRSA